jgi:hypothetical protein
MRHLCWLGAIAFLIALGCAGEPETEPDAEKPQPAEQAEEPAGGVKVVDVAKLPELGDPLPDGRDRGRINNVAPPKGWQPLVNDSDFVARFAVNKQNPNDLPRILISAADATGFTDDVNADNVAAFAEAVTAELAEQKGVEEQPLALTIGDNAFVRYVMLRRKAQRSVRQEILETVFDNRRYRIALEVFNHKPQHRDQQYAVAGGMKFVKPAAP